MVPDLPSYPRIQYTHLCLYTQTDTCACAWLGPWTVNMFICNCKSRVSRVPRFKSQRVKSDHSRPFLYFTFLFSPPLCGVEHFNVWHTYWTLLVLLIRMVHIWNRDHIMLFAFIPVPRKISQCHWFWAHLGCVGHWVIRCNKLFRLILTLKQWVSS